MENEANTPSGTGYTTEEATLAISAILDSETPTPVEAVVETDETTSDDYVTEEIEARDEQPEMDSEHVEIDEDAELETTTDEKPTEVTDDYEFDLPEIGKVTAGELKRGYLRQADYTRKTQEVSRTKAELDATIYGFNEKALAELETVKKNLAIEFKYNQPDWGTLLQENPYEFAEKRMEWDKREQIVQQLHAYEVQTRENQIAFEKQKFETDQAAARDYLSSKYSEFQSKETAAPIMKEMVGTLKEFGFSREEIESVADGRILEAIYWAAKGRAASTKAESAKKVLADTPKVTPVKTNTNQPRTSYSSLRQQFNADPSNMDVATALISKLL
jgi:hypothetical protein